MIEEDQSIQIAKESASEKSWAFVEPLEVIVRKGWFGGVKRFEIETNAGKRGAKAKFVIDARTGEVLSEGYIPR